MGRSIVMTEATTSSVARAIATAGPLYYRHTLPVRIMHWINVLALTLLFMSGLNIFDAHPALYWGKSSYTGRAALLEIGAVDRGERGVAGITRVFGREFDTTGVLGVSRSASGTPEARAFPWWITVPDNRWLSMARSWHFFFAWVFVVNGLCYIVYSLWSRHLARDLLPTRPELRTVGQSIKDHLRFRPETGEAAKRYNVLQKLAYLIVIFVLLPLIVLMGLAMAPRLDALFTGWVDLFGGRQSARTIHFVAAWLLVAFVLIHVFQVIVTGLWNNLRSMITGRYRVPGAHHE
jgi:thiosulfate reductase cytochrome b subunit